VPEELRFEEAMRRLDEAVRALEGGALDLDDSLARYEEGVRLIARCRALLDGAERRVALLCAVGPDGQPVTRDLGSPAGPDVGEL
jgi:exodeoxyribonuclease VII small subunit